MSYRPLADEIRPTSLDEVVGQGHILGKDGLLRRIVEGGNVPNLIFYGPSGTGKTTVANIIAQRTNRPLHRLNATTASISTAAKPATSTVSATARRSLPRISRAASWSCSSTAAAAPPA